MFQIDSPLVIMRGGGRNLAYQHPESLLPGLSNQVVRLLMRCKLSQKKQIIAIINTRCRFQ